jgi:hypothetical protein
VDETPGGWMKAEMLFWLAIVGEYAVLAARLLSGCEINEYFTKLSTLKALRDKDISKPPVYSSGAK